MPGVPMPDAATENYLEGARQQVADSLKGIYPDSMLAPPIAPRPPAPALAQGAIPTPGGPAQSAEPVTAAPDQAPQAPPEPVEQPKLSDSVVQATKQLGTEVGSGVVRAAAHVASALGFLGVGAQRVLGPQLGVQNEAQMEESENSVFDFIRNHVDPLYDQWKVKPEDSNPAAQFVGSAVEGLAPVVLGPAAGVPAMVASATTEAGKDSVDRGENIKTATSLALVAAASNGLSLGIGYKDPSIVKRIAKWVGAGEVINRGSEALTKWILSNNGYQQAAANVDWANPTQVGIDALTQTVFALLHSPGAPKGTSPKPVEAPKEAAQPSDIPPPPPAAGPENTAGPGPGAVPVASGPYSPVGPDGKVRFKQPGEDLSGGTAGETPSPPAEPPGVGPAPTAEPAAAPPPVLPKVVSIKAKVAKKAAAKAPVVPETAPPEAPPAAEAAPPAEAPGVTESPQAVTEAAPPAESAPPAKPQTAVAAEAEVLAAKQKAARAARRAGVESPPETPPIAEGIPSAASETPVKEEVAASAVAEPPSKPAEGLQVGDRKLVKLGADHVAVSVEGPATNGRVPVRLLDEDGRKIGAIQTIPEHLISTPKEPTAEVASPKEAPAAEPSAKAAEPAAPKVTAPEAPATGLSMALGQFKAAEQVPKGKKYAVGGLKARVPRIAEFARAVRAAAEASDAPDEVKKFAIDAARKPSNLDSKTQEAIAKNQGVGHPELDSHAATLIRAAENLLNPEKADLTPPAGVQADKLKAKQAAKVDAKAAEIAKLAEEQSADANADVPKAAPKYVPISQRETVVARARRLGISIVEAKAQIEAERGSADAPVPKARPKVSRESEAPELVKSAIPDVEDITKPKKLNPDEERQIRNAAHRFYNAEPEDLEWAKDNLHSTIHNVYGESRAPEAEQAFQSAVDAGGSIGRKPSRAEEIEKDLGVKGIDYRDAEDHDTLNGERARVTYAPTPNAYSRSPVLKLTSQLARGDFFQRLEQARRTQGAFLSTHEVLDHMIESAKQSPIMGAILRTLRRNVSDAPIRVVDRAQSMRSADVYGERIAGLYHVKSNTIQIVNHGRFSQVEIIHSLIHEIVHAATEFRLQTARDSSLVHIFRIMRSQVLQVLKESGASADDIKRIYGLSDRFNERTGRQDVSEFIAEAMSNPQFQGILASIEAHDPRPVYRNLLDKVAGAIGKLIGIKPEAMSMLRQILTHTEYLMREQEAQLGWNKFGIKAPAFLAKAYKKSPEVMTRLSARGADDFMPGLDEALGERELASVHDRLQEPPRPLENEEKFRSVMGDHATEVNRFFRRAIRTGAIEEIRRATRALTDFGGLVRVALRNEVFGHIDDPTNPLRNYDQAMQDRNATANWLHHDLPEVSAQWSALSRVDDLKLSNFLRDSTMLRIDPRVAAVDDLPKAMAELPKQVTGDPKFEEKWKNMHARWANLDPHLQDLYGKVIDFNEKMAREQRKATVNAALESYSDKQISDAQRRLLYSVDTPEKFDSIIGTGKDIDVGDKNEALSSALKELSSLHEINGPYVHLGRYGDHVVSVKPVGSKDFELRSDAEQFAQTIRNLSPGSKAKVEEIGGKWNVGFKAEHVSMHESLNEAHAEVARLRGQLGDDMVGSATTKVLSKTSIPLSKGLESFVARASQKLGKRGQDEATKDLQDSMRRTVAEMLAQRSAAAGSRLARKNFGGVKPGEMQRAFVDHAKSSAYHTAQIAHMFKVGEALGRLQESVRDSSVAQSVADQRGRVYDEITRRAKQESQQYGSTPALNHMMARLGFLNYMTSLSHSIVNLSQNFLVAGPTAVARFGPKALGSMNSAMATVAGPAFRQAFRAQLGRGDLDSVVNAIVKAVAQDKRFGKWAQGQNSPLQQMIDRGAIHSSLSSQLEVASRGGDKLLGKTFDLARVMPAMSDAFNRITTGLAALELHKGDVYKAADFVKETHMDYSMANRSRGMRAANKVWGGNSIAMFKTYTMGMAHLLYSNMFDLARRDGGKAEAMRVIAGLMLGASLTAGVQRGTGLEPLRLAMYAWRKLAGDENEYGDFDNESRRWVSDAVGGGTAADVINGGLPRALGFDMSSRLGLSDLLIHDPPDLLGADQTTLAKFGFDQLGPIGQMLVEKHQALNDALESGRVSDWIKVLPIKIAQNVNDAIQEATSGKQNSLGAQLTAPSVGAAVAKGIGFKSAEEAGVMEKEHTASEYKAFARERQFTLMKDYIKADPEDKGDVWHRIQQFNATNPGHMITFQSLIKLQRGARGAENIAQGIPGRDSKLNELVNY